MDGKNATIKKTFYTNYGDDHKEESDLNPCTNLVIMLILGRVMLDSVQS